MKIDNPQTAFGAIQAALCRAHRRLGKEGGFPKNVLIRFFNFPLGTGSSTAATTASK
jgi:hypothetical protein